MSKGVYINDREYYFYNMKGNKYVLVANPKNIYNDDILEVELIDDDYVSLKLIRFESGIIKSVTYIEQLDSCVMFEYCSKERQNLYANEFEQHNQYLMKYQHLGGNYASYNVLKIKLENRGPFLFDEIDGHYMFIDKDGDEFKITCRAIGEAKTFVSWIIPSIPRIVKYINKIRWGCLTEEEKDDAISRGFSEYDIGEDQFDMFLNEHGYSSKKIIDKQKRLKRNI